MHPDFEDAALLARAAEGDTRAFDQLVDRYATRVYAICWRYFGSADDAEDAAQGAFLALYRGLSSFSGRAAFSTWLYRVTTNACHDLARRNARLPRTVPFDSERSAVFDTAAADELAAAELQSDLTAALRLLEPEQRHAVVLRDVVGASYADIAAAQDVAIGTAKSRVHRGHARLAELLEPVRNQMSPQRPPTMQD